MTLVLIGVAGAWSPAGATTTNSTGPDRYRQFLFGARNRINPTETTLGAHNVATLAPAWTAATGTANPFAAPVVDGDLLIEGE
jgi:hypothetical protein